MHVHSQMHCCSAACESIHVDSYVARSEYLMCLQAQVMPPRSRCRRATEPWENSKERSDKIEFRMEALLVQGYRCFSQAYFQAERMIDNKKWLRKKELNKIQTECGDECCDPKRIAKTSVRTPAQKLEYERERLAKQDNDEERNATSSAILGSVNTTIPEAATKHSLTRRLLTLANENPRSSEAATDTWEKWTAQGNSQWASTTSAATEHNTHHTHLAAVILDAAIERTASSSYTAVRTKAWFNNLKQDVIDVTFVPLTRCALARRSARPPKKKQRKGGIWPTSIESISRCVAAYHRAANGAEHDECDGIVDNIGAYAHTLCTRTNCSDQLLKLLHQWIENRSINMALRLCLERCLAERTCWKHVTDEERAQAVHLMKTAMEIVQMNGERLHRCMDNLRSTVN